eukprot:1453219-Pyramimonas_sp.AAC.1
MSPIALGPERSNPRRATRVWKASHAICAGLRGHLSVFAEEARGCGSARAWSGRSPQGRHRRATPSGPTSMGLRIR